MILFSPICGSIILVCDLAISIMHSLSTVSPILIITSPHFTREEREETRRERGEERRGINDLVDYYGNTTVLTDEPTTGYLQRYGSLSPLALPRFLLLCCMNELYLIDLIEFITLESTAVFPATELRKLTR